MWVAKNAPVVMSDMPRDVPCDRCQKVGRLCLSWIKGGQALSTCAVCYGVKMSCKTSVGVAASKKEVEQEEPEVAVPEQEGKMGRTEDTWKGTETPQDSCSVGLDAP